MSDQEISIETKPVTLKSIIIDKVKGVSEEITFKKKLIKLKKQYALLVANIETDIEGLEEKFIENCSESDFNLENLISIKDEIDLLERKRKVANEIYVQLTGE